MCPRRSYLYFSRGVQYSGINIFNHLSSGIRDLSNDVKSFQAALKEFLQADMFYTVDDFVRDKNQRFWLGINLL
jgi:hypothetical protein